MIVLSFESTTFEGKREFHNCCVVFQGTGEGDCSISCLFGSCSRQQRQTEDLAGDGGR